MTAMQPDKVTPSDDVDWLAFRYVLNDLPAADREEFEARMATDLRACEAVARAVRLQMSWHTCNLRRPGGHVLARRIHQRPLRLALAAGLILAVTLWQFVRLKAVIRGSLWHCFGFGDSVSPSDDGDDSAAEEAGEDESANELQYRDQIAHSDVEESSESEIVPPGYWRP